jgi:DNA uptake protein ComE-like DNA-binding protein
MMQSRLLPLALALLASLPWQVRSAELGVLAPVIADGKPAERAAPDGDMAPVVTRVTSGKLFEQLQREARDGFTASMLALDEKAQRMSGQAQARPTWLYLSMEDGGFARTGFWLQDAGGVRYVDEPFVDLVVDEDSIANGAFEEIFAHELGHVFLRRLLPTLPLGHSTTQHAALAVTDRPTAFDEGFAIHFQGLVRHLTRNEQLRLEDDGLTGKPFLPYWDSHVDRTMRLEGVRRNLFVQSQVTLPGEGDAVELRDHSTLFDTARLKSGDQMMASEGVNATVFYRWLVPGEGTTEALVARYGRLFTALSKLDGTRLEADSPVLIRLLQTYAAQFPQEGRQAIRVFMETTYASTVDPGMARQTEALAERGRVGDMEGFVGGLKPARAALGKLVDEAVASPARLDAALSTPIWISNASGTEGEGKGEGLVIDLNTAEREGLMAMPGIDAALADRIVAERRSNGPYASLATLSTRLKLAPAMSTRLAGYQQAAQRAGTVRRP